MWVSHVCGCMLAGLMVVMFTEPVLTLWHTTETWSWWVSGRKRSVDAAWSSSGAACDAAAP